MATERENLGHKSISNLEVAEKVFIPLVGAFLSLVAAVLAAVLVFITDRQASKIADQQNQIQRDIASIQTLQFSQELEQKYIEIFYDEMTSGNASRQTIAISLLREINPQTGEKLNLWAQRSGILKPQAQQESINVQLQLQIQRIVQQINSSDRSTRLTATDTLKNQYSDSVDAVNGVLALFSPENIGSLSAEGRINALFFLKNTKASAWTPDLIQRGNQAIELLEERHQNGTAPIGQQTRQYLEDFKRYLSSVKAEIGG
jgi:hypothetical protein